MVLRSAAMHSGILNIGQNTCLILKNERRIGLMANTKKVKGTGLTRDQRKFGTATIMLLPALLFLALLIAYPLGKVIHDAFTHVHLINKSLSGFAGLENFQKVISDEHFGQAIKNTGVWTVFSVLGEFLMGMLTAVLLNQKFKGRAIFRTFVFIPWLVPIVVAGMTWDWMLSPDFGIINYILTNLHIVKEPINFLGRCQVRNTDGNLCQYMEKFPILYNFISFCNAVNSRRTE